MRIVLSLLTAICLIVVAEASATGVATPQSQAAPSAPKPSTTDQIRHPTANSVALAQRMCQTQCNWIGGRQFSHTASDLYLPMTRPRPPWAGAFLLGIPRPPICSAPGDLADAGAISR